MDFLSAVQPMLAQAWGIFVLTYPFWLPILLIAIFWQLWVNFVRTRWRTNTKFCVLEIRIPRDIFKSPRAMEVVFNSLYNTADESNFVYKYWKGQVRPWFSFEIVSDFGQLHFYIWAQEKHKNYIESQIYAQYPEVEVRQVEDYSQNFAFIPKVNNLWGARFEKAGPNPLPIPTYVDYGLDQSMVKEEQKIDPLAQLLELMSVVLPGEHIWLQIGIQAHKKERADIWSKETDWREEIASVRKQIFEQIKKEERGRPSASETELLEALGRAYQKYPFNCVIRAFYWAEEAKNYRPPMIGTIVTLLRPFSYSASVFSDSFKKDTLAGFNGFKPAKGGGGMAPSDYPWQDFLNIAGNRARRRFVDAYKRRSFFHSPYKFKPFIMTSEELATMYHFPGATVAAPKLARIPSKRAQAPSNLPI